jgi:trans-2-enoyl-CoA reductase-like protein
LWPPSRRTDPCTRATYLSVIKPRRQASPTKTLDFDADGAATLREVTVGPATEQEVADTVRVMGGEDWARWVMAFSERGLLREGFHAVALSYIGSPITAAIYRQGTIGAAKENLEQTSHALDAHLAPRGGAPFTSINGAAVTQASAAIPGVALYVSRCGCGTNSPGTVSSTWMSKGGSGLTDGNWPMTCNQRSRGAGRRRRPAPSTPWPTSPGSVQDSEASTDSTLRVSTTTSPSRLTFRGPGS